MDPQLTASLLEFRGSAELCTCDRTVASCNITNATETGGCNIVFRVLKSVSMELLHKRLNADTNVEIYNLWRLLRTT